MPEGRGELEWFAECLDDLAHGGVMFRCYWAFEAHRPACGPFYFSREPPAVVREFLREEAHRQAARRAERARAPCPA